MTWKDFENEPTENLIEYIQWQNDEEYFETSKLAFHAFCFRFNAEFRKVCIIIAEKMGYDADFGDELADLTFNKFWRKPFTFTPTLCNCELHKCVILYLSSIAQNLLIDKNKELNSDNPYDGSEQIIHDLPDVRKIPTLEKRRELKRVNGIIEQALARLTPKHKIVYLTYRAYEKDGFKLPRQLLKDLREELDLTQDSIRVYKNQSFETVNQFMNLYGSK
jgi:hypothetical protein